MAPQFISSVNLSKLSSPSLRGYICYTLTNAHSIMLVEDEVRHPPQPSVQCSIQSKYTTNSYSYYHVNRYLWEIIVPKGSVGILWKFCKNSSLYGCFSASHGIHYPGECVRGQKLLTSPCSWYLENHLPHYECSQVPHLHLAFCISTHCLCPTFTWSTPVHPSLDSFVSCPFLTTALYLSPGSESECELLDHYDFDYIIYYLST